MLIIFFCLLRLHFYYHFLCSKYLMLMSLYWITRYTQHIHRVYNSICKWALDSAALKVTSLSASGEYRESFIWHENGMRVCSGCWVTIHSKWRLVSWCPIDDVWEVSPGMTLRDDIEARQPIYCLSWTNKRHT